MPYGKKVQTAWCYKIQLPFRFWVFPPTQHFVDTSNKRRCFSDESTLLKNTMKLCTYTDTNTCYLTKWLFTLPQWLSKVSSLYNVLKIFITLCRTIAQEQKRLISRTGPWFRFWARDEVEMEKTFSAFLRFPFANHNSRITALSTHKSAALKCRIILAKSVSWDLVLEAAVV